VKIQEEKRINNDQFKVNKIKKKI